MQMLRTTGLTIALIAFIICTSFGVDHRTTLNLTPASYVIVALMPAMVACLVWRAFMLDSSAQKGLLALSQLRRDAPGKWLIQGIRLLLFSAVLSAATTWYFLSVLVPYLPGQAHGAFGVIERMDSVSSRGRLCNEYAVVLLESGGTTKFCYERGAFVPRRISTVPLKIGDRIVIVISDTPIGSAIKSVSPAPVRPEVARYPFDRPL